MPSAGLRHRSRHVNEERPNQAPANGLGVDGSQHQRPNEADLQSTERHGSAASFLPITLRAPDSNPDEHAVQPPRFTVDLSVKPEHRYDHIAPQLRDVIDKSDLGAIFDDMVRFSVPRRLVPAVLALARMTLRRLFDREETAELRGICVSTGTPMHLLVAFNVLLDLLLGCSSGGVRVACPDPGSAAVSSCDTPLPRESTSRMLHFRTLDWGMDPLRALVVELDFVRRAGGPVVATSVTYFGYVGVLTGVRRGLSMSLNFRPHHDRSSLHRRVAFRWHQAMAVLGFRQSVSSVLRSLLLTPDEELDGNEQTSIGHPRGAREEKKAADSSPSTPRPKKTRGAVSPPIVPFIREALPSTRSTAAYLIFCTPQEALTLEKDNGHGAIQSSTVFHGTYNHDMQDEAEPERLKDAAHGATEQATGMEGLVAWSVQRKHTMESHWKRAVRRARRDKERGSEHRHMAVDGSCSSGRAACDVVDAVRPADVVRMVLHREISNEETHYAVVMDPGLGKVLWRRVFPLEVQTVDDGPDETGSG